ncbi:MAG: response regulator [Phycisphaeraceae bacterium]
MNKAQTALAAFQAEHREQLEGIRRGLRACAGSDPRAARAGLEEAYRLAHRFKAGARDCELPQLEAIGRGIETALSRLREGKIQPDAQVTGAIDAALNAVEDWMAALAAGSERRHPVAALEALYKVLGMDAPTDKAATSDLDLLSRVRAAFQEEYREYLDGLTRFLSNAEHGQGAPDRAGIDEAFRIGHSLKGAARVAEVPVVETLGHRLETLLARVREGTIELDKLCLSAIQDVIEAIESEMARLSTNQPSLGQPAVVGVLDAVLAGGVQLPSVEPADVDDLDRGKGSPAVAEPSPAEKGVPGAHGETVRVSVDSLDRLAQSADRLHGEIVRCDEVTGELARFQELLDELGREWESVCRTSSKGLRQLEAMPEFAGLARYLGFAVQQTRRLQRQERKVRLLQQHTTWSLSSVSHELRREVRRARLVSADSVLHGLQRHVRDLARDLEKKVDFQTVGLQIPADRAVLQALKDPLMHMLRNALVHGIESPAQRRRKNKSETGQLRLELQVVGPRFEASVHDDGAGIDLVKVEQIARRRGLLGDQVNRSPLELARLIFEPGFTTTDTVTELAGRGMGLSVVQEAAARLRGEVFLRQRSDAGTCMVISVPLSMSTHRVLLVTCAQQTLALPVEAIQSLVKVRRADIGMIEGRHTLEVDGEPVPLTSLAQLLQIEERGVSVNGDSFFAVVLRSNSASVAAAVDTIVAEREMVVKNLDAVAARVSHFSGGVLLETGDVALMVHPAAIIANARRLERHELVIEHVDAAPTTRRPVVLVVDDSFTARTLEKGIMEAQGFDVRVAVDGIEALSLLKFLDVDVVISDIQMPRLDGFGLLEQMKQQPRLANIPVILVTSLEGREDKERGMALGADAYVVKRKFDHEELTRTIRQFVRV